VVSLMRAPACVGEVRHLGLTLLDEELDLLADAASDHRFAGLFCTAASPGIVAAAMENRHYPDLDDYVGAVASALEPEYRRIVNRGFDLQIDAPDLAMERHVLFADRPLEAFLDFARTVVSHVNRVIAGLDPACVRLHVCWGNYNGPHHLDVPLEAIWEVLAEARVGTLVLSAANPRHAHEVRLLRRLAPDQSVVVGVIDTTTNYIEHPEVVADRIVAAAEAVGDPSRVIAGTDCGFSTAAGMEAVASEVAWAKLAALTEGARIASARLFG
jgi:5-methyltetrahydropteroyltriglutamate--homocysteine methyltransferase